MSRRSTPERIYAAHREGMRQRLMGTGMSDATAEAWVAAWEARTPRDSLERGSGYWDAGWDWIDAQRRPRARP